MSLTLPAGMQITAPIKPEWQFILSTEALELVAKLHRSFEPRRQELLKKRVERPKPSLPKMPWDDGDPMSPAQREGVDK